MKKIILVFLLIAAIGGVFAYMQYNKPHQNIEKASVDAQIEATALFDAYTKDEAAANQKYTGKIIEVTGKVKEVTKTPDGAAKVNLEAAGDAMFGVSCALDAKQVVPAFAIGQNVTMKGKCDGFNLDVQLSTCVVK
jgi:tRNA_anti-like